MVENVELPKGWVSTNLGNICKLRNGYAFKSADYIKESGIPIVRISDIGDEKVDLKDCVRIKENEEYENYRITKNEILIAMSGATTGKFGIYKGNNKVYQNQRVGKFEILFPEVLNNSYLLYVLHSLKNRILMDAYGGAQPNISSGKVEELPITIPPLSEQHRIVAKIEELFSSLDKGIESLKTAQAQLKTYRQAVLKWAFEGKLTNENVKDGELPEGWKWEKLGAIAEKVTDGEHITPKRSSDGVLLLSARNVQNGFLSLDNVDYIPEEEYQRIIKRCNPQENDILISCSGSVGRVTLVPPKVRFTLVRSVALVKLNKEKYFPKFYLYLLLSPLLQHQIEDGKKATAQANLFLGPIKTLKVIICSHDEQSRIVAEIEKRLSVCDKMEESITQSLQQAEALRQSILKKAFEGKLVPQDPSDEPASVLLERIRAERSASIKESLTVARKRKKS
jgi:type I restriction enzyme, S subunit